MSQRQLYRASHHCHPSHNGIGAWVVTEPRAAGNVVNEVLCKILAQNLVVLIHEMYELGIAPVFEAERTLAS